MSSSVDLMNLKSGIGAQGTCVVVLWHRNGRYEFEI